MPETVAVVPVPVVVTAPGVLVSVHVPAAGKPLKSTLPDPTAHVGCVIVPALGAAGAAGWALTVAAVAAELHPPVLFIITLYDPAASAALLLPAWKVAPLSKL